MVFRPSDGKWYFQNWDDDDDTSVATFGYSTDRPVPGDFDDDGDGIFDAAVFRPSTATWYILYSGGGSCTKQFGDGADIPIPALYTPYYQ